MRELFSIVRDILLLKRGPQDVPYAPNLTLTLIFVGIVMHVAVQFVSGETFVRAGLVAVVSAGFSLGVLYLLLHARQFAARFTQTALTQALTSLVFSLLVLPLLAMVAGANPASLGPVSPGQALAVLVAFGIVVWDFIVDAHIMRHALDVPLGAGVLVTMLMRISTLIVVFALFGKTDGS